jgi:hypothetical protein
LQEGANATRIDFPWNHPGGKQRFDFRSEKKTVGPSRMIVIKRLDAQAIASQEKLASSQIPDCEGEHTPQPLDATIAVLFVEVNNNFRVRRGAKLMTPSDQRRAKLGGVVTFAVVSDPYSRVFVTHRHMPAFAKVHDREARISQDT